MYITSVASTCVGSLTLYGYEIDGCCEEENCESDDGTCYCDSDCYFFEDCCSDIEAIGCFRKSIIST